MKHDLIGDFPTRSLPVKVGNLLPEKKNSLLLKMRKIRFHLVAHMEFFKNIEGILFYLQGGLDLC